MPKDLFFLMSGTGRRQANRDTPIPLAGMDERINLTSKNMVEGVKTIEDVLDCLNEEVTRRETTRVLYRLPVEGQFHAPTAAKMLAYAKGVAADPTGATANAVITVTVAGATSGWYTLELDYEGFSAPTAPIPYDASAEVFRYALENTDPVGFGNTQVAKAGGVYTITFVGKRAAAAIPNLSVADSSQLGGVGATVTPVLTTPGTQRQHAIDEMATDLLPYTSFCIGFEDEAGSERQLVGASVDNIRFRLPDGNGIVTWSADIIARDVRPAPGLIIPVCTQIRPIRTGDCIFEHNGVNYSSLEKFVDGDYTYGNSIITSNSAYTSRGVRPTRFVRALRRSRGLTFRLLGGVTEALYQEAARNPEADVKRATSLRIGTEGDSVTETFPNNLLELDTGGGVGFSSDTGEALQRYISTATKVGSTNPSNTVAAVPQSVAHLLAPGA